MTHDLLRTMCHYFIKCNDEIYLFKARFKLYFKAKVQNLRTSMSTFNDETRL